MRASAESLRRALCQQATQHLRDACYEFRDDSLLRSKCTITAKKLFAFFSHGTDVDFRDPGHSFAKNARADMPEHLRVNRKRVVMYFDINAGDDGHRFVVVGDWCDASQDMVYVLMQSNDSQSCGEVFSFVDGGDMASFVIQDFPQWWAALLVAATSRDLGDSNFAKGVRLTGNVMVRSSTSFMVVVV